MELGLVDQHGVQLGLTGAFAGVGDWVEARRLGHELVAYEGNTRAPRTRELFRVAGVRADGGLEVTSDLRRPALTTPPPSSAAPTASRRRRWCSRPPTWPRTWRSATPVPSTAGSATPSTAASPSSPAHDRAAVLVDMTRGQEPTQAHSPPSTARPTPPTAPAAPAARSPGRVRRPRLERDEPDLSALAIQTEHQRWRESLQTISEVSPRSATPPPPPAPHLARPAHRPRRAHDRAAGPARRRGRRREPHADPAPRRDRRPRPLPVCTRRSPPSRWTGRGTWPNVVYARMRDAPRLRPTRRPRGRTVPALDNPGMQRFAERWPTAGRREPHLGAQTAAEPPRWATELLGPVPDAESDPDARAAWEPPGWSPVPGR